MMIETIPSNWLIDDGHRLDPRPFVSGAVGARKRLESFRCVPLKTLTSGYKGGIFTHNFSPKRTYVTDPQHGVPFLGASAIFLSDHSGLPLLSNRDAESRSYRDLKIKEGMTIVTSSGIVGRAAYARSDMAGMFSSGDTLKIAPDPAMVPPGYVFAFLTCEYGVPLVAGGTYGSIIQHLEAQHVSELPIPRLNKNTEAEAHRLVCEASENRVAASLKIADAKQLLLEHLGPVPNTLEARQQVASVVNSSELRATSRLEGFFYNPTSLELDHWIDSHEMGSWTLGEIADVFDVPPFKHIYVEQGHGTPFFTSGDLFVLDRKCRHHLSRTQTKGLDKYTIEAGWVLLARSGQLGGIIGRPQFTDSALDKCATSDHVIRLVPRDVELTPPGFLFAYLDLQSIGYPLLTRTIAGKSVPALWPCYLNDVKVLRADTTVRKRVHNEVAQAFEMRVIATQREDEARAIVSHEIERRG